MAKTLGSALVSTTFADDGSGLSPEHPAAISSRNNDKNELAKKTIGRRQRRAWLAFFIPRTLYLVSGFAFTGQIHAAYEKRLNCNP
jgi:hypothetical protein